MELMDILMKVKRDTDGAIEDHLCTDALLMEFVDCYSEFNYTKFYEEARLRAWFFAPFVDGCEIVGESALYMDDIPVAYLRRNGRKDRYSFKWMNVTTFGIVREYLLSLISNSTKEPVFMTFSEKSADVGEGFKVNHVNQLASQYGTHLGEPVIISPFDENKQVSIKHTDGLIRVVDILSVNVDYLLEKK
ncbi:hypothetical protein PQC39_gp095 [Vibrio phage Vp_R1]|uniref:Uncharacterized protein n=1 Tax=Vibrio phage Vp_R1 TaxID=2059867 RepID=A0A2H5BQ46_9CAUD|nr:hypothetical protein PQC39_gp095 [Vibrio phage Vp_R1]AUG88459.1 hypothetical protein VPR_095 [Vibrio phage Vp_R1]